MTWKDRLQDASFRGVPFKVEEESAGTGRRVETHEYPNRDKPYKTVLTRAELILLRGFRVYTMHGFRRYRWCKFLIIQRMWWW